MSGNHYPTWGGSTRGSRMLILNVLRSYNNNLILVTSINHIIPYCFGEHRHECRFTCLRVTVSAMEGSDNNSHEAHNLDGFSAARKSDGAAQRGILAASPAVAAGTGGEPNSTVSVTGHESSSGLHSSMPLASPTIATATATAATAAAAVAGPGFVAPSSYLRPVGGTRVPGAANEAFDFTQAGGASRVGGPPQSGMRAVHPFDKEQTDGLVR
jgi:hypothetical protein